MKNSEIEEGMATLSMQEDAVFQWMINDQQPREIAKKMGLSTKTVATYRARIIKKTGLQSVVQMALWAERNGLKTWRNEDG